MKSIILYSVYLLIFFGQLNAQTSPKSPDFAIRFGANSTNHGQQVWGVKIDDQGNTYATGNFNATTNFNTLGTALNLTANSNFQDGFLVKYNSSGIAQWVIPFASQSGSTAVSNSNGGTAVTTDASGNVYVTGYFWGTVDFDPSPTATRNLTSNGNADIFIAKYNSNGQYQWAYTMGGSGADVGIKIITDNSGNIYLAATFNGSIQTNTTGSGTSKTLSALGGRDIAIIKYNSSGVFQDAISINSANTSEIANDVQVDSNNNLFLVGTYSGTLTCASLSITSAGFSDCFVLKLNSSLVPQTFFSEGGVSSDEGKNIAIDRNNDVVISGLVTGTANTNINMNNSGGSPSNITIVNQGREAFISKYDNNGVFKWATVTQGTESTRIPRPMGLGIDSCNNIVLAGSFTSTFDFDPNGTGGSFSAAASNLWGGAVVKFTSLGEYLWGFMLTGFTVNFFGFDYNQNINKYAVGGDLITNTTYPNVDVDPTSGTRNLTSFNATFGAALLAVYPDPGNVIPTITLGTISSVVNSATSFTIPYSATTGSPNQFSIVAGTPNTMPSFSAVTNSTLQASPISVSIPPSTANTYNFNFSVRSRASGCMSANIPLALVVNAPVAPPTITSFTPTSAKPGDAVTITGTNFNTTAANNIVFFGATRATVTAATATSLTVTVPTGATYAPITLLNTGTTLACASLANFTPIYSPAKTSFGTSDMSPKVDFATGTQPLSVAIGDLDGDGKPDLAVANSSSNTISVFRNTSSSGSIGSGSFAAKVDFITGTQPTSVAIGDLDGDGKPDLAVANRSSNTISVFRNISSSGNIGSGSFAAKVDFATGNGAHSVAIGDLDGDGKPDLAVANRAAGTVSIFRNTSSTGSIVAGSFAAKVDFTTATLPTSVAIGDLDGDGKPDLAVSNSGSSSISILRNTSSSGSIIAGSFAAKVDFTTGVGPTSFAIGDLDGDNKLDLVSVNYSQNTLSVLRNTSSSGSIVAGSFATKVDFVTPANPQSVKLGDLDGDGKPDLAVANNGSNNLSIFRNASTSGSITSVSFAARVDFTTGTNPTSIDIGDLDGDGKPDLISGNFNSNNISVLRNADIATSTINVSGTLNAFTACAGSFSTTQSFTVGGSNLTNNVVITAPTGFEVSTTSGSGFGSSITLTQTGGNVSNTTIFVRLAATATGTPSGNLTVASTGATTQNVAVSGTVNALPTITLGSVANITTTATSFSLPYSATTGNPNIYSISVGTPNAMNGFTTGLNTMPTTSPINVPIPASAVGTYNFNIGVVNSTIGCNSNLVPFTVTVGATANPTISTTGTLNAFTKCGSTASAAQSFTVNGNNLTNDIVITPPAGFEVSIVSSGGFAPSIVLTQFEGTLLTTTIFVRMRATATGTASGNITVASTGATTQNLAVSGVSTCLPTITLGSVANITTTATSFSLPFTSVTGNPDGYTITATTPNAMSGFSTITDVFPSTSPINVTIPASQPGTYNFNIRIFNFSTALQSDVYPFTVTVLAPSSPTITTTGTLNAFTACAGSSSTTQSFTVGGSNLTNNVVITAPTGFEVSTTSSSGFGTSVTLTQTGGTVSNTSIFVRLAATATGTPSGNITVVSTGATTQNVAVSGTVNALPTITLGSVANITTTATSFSLPYTATTGNPDQYTINSAGPTPMNGFSSVVNASLPASPITVPIPASAANMYNFRLRITNSTTGCFNSMYPFTVTVTPSTAININGTLSVVNTTYGVASSSPTSFSVSATGLTNVLTITPPSGFEVSTNQTSGFASSINLTPNNGVVNSTLVYVRLASTTSVGTYSGNIVCSSVGAPSQSISTVSSSVSPAALTITANNASKTYGATASLSQFTATGLVNSDAVSAVSLSSTGSPATAAVGTYPITASNATGTGLANYTITYNNGTLTVNPAALTITANNASKTYGATASLTQFTATGLVNSDAVSAVTLSSTGSPATAAVGTYPITASSATGTGLANYTITYNNGTLTVNPAALTITANNASKTYGATASLTQFTAAGLVNSDAVSAVTLSSTGSPATAAVGTYPITASNATGTGLANYTITYNNGTLTVNPAALTITANNASKTYGATASLTQFTATGLVNSDAVSTVTLSSTGSPATASVGTYPITASSAIGTGLGNYTITYNNGTLTVNPAALTITANNASKTYGATASLSQFTATGLVNSDAVSAVTLSSTGSPATAAVGTYPITASNATGTGLANYTITYNNGTLTVNPAALTITANNANKFYGLTLNPTQFTTTGLVNSDAVSAVTLSSTGSPATAAVGTYPITASNATGTGLGNYTITYNNGTLTVNPAPLTITANNANKFYGLTLNPTQFTVGGLVNGDAVTSVSLTSTGSPATASVGNYPITASNAIGTGLGNYTITYNNGTMTVLPISLTITAANQTKCQGVAFNIPSDAYGVNGLVNGDRVNSVNLFSVGASIGAAAGTYNIVPSGATGVGLSNYTITYINGTFTVNALPAVTASASSSSVSRGRNVTLTATGTGSFAWSPSFGLVSPNAAVTEARVIESSTYTVTLTGLNGCRNSAIVTVESIEDLFVEPSIIFTPNGDGINDRFVIKNIDAYPQNRLQVYDRAGRLLYEQNNYSNNWDGIVNGKPLQKDNYFYVLTVNNKIVKRGTLTLIR